MNSKDSAEHVADQVTDRVIDDDSTQASRDTLRRSLVEATLNAIETAQRRDVEDQRIILQGDLGYFVLKLGSVLEEPLILAAAGRSLEGEREASEEEALYQRLYDEGFRRKSAAAPFRRPLTEETLDTQSGREALAEELVTLAEALYSSELDRLSCATRILSYGATSNQKLLNAMRTLSEKRDMSSRQKVYWALIRADVWLALREEPPQELTQERGRARWVEAGLKSVEHVQHTVAPKSFSEVTGYRSLGVFSDLEALELIDPRGAYRVMMPGRLAIEIARAQKWDSLLVNPRSKVGGELYKNELDSIIEGLTRMGW